MATLEKNAEALGMEPDALAAEHAHAHEVVARIATLEDTALTTAELTERSVSIITEELNGDTLSPIGKLGLLTLIVFEIAPAQRLVNAGLKRLGDA